MREPSGLRDRRFPRFNTWHHVEVATRDGRLRLPGLLCNLSQEGCCLRLDGQLGTGTPIEVRCDISGLALCLQGEIVWVTVLGGLLHGVAISGFASEADTLFHRRHLDRLAREASIPPEPA